MFAKFRCIILLLMMLPLFFGGCTHNDGDIGDLFGRWKLVSLSADGEERSEERRVGKECRL